MDSEFIARICLVANQAKQNEYDDVAVWMQQHLTADIHAARSRSGRRRGVPVRLLGGRVKVVLDERQVRALMERRT